MSRTSTKDYLLKMREDYLGEWDRRKRSCLLDEACRVTGLERKYVNKILLGQRDYRERKGRGKGHSPAAETLLIQAWEGAGCPCAKYLKSTIGKVLEDLGELQNVRDEDARQVLAMSASTMERILRALLRQGKIRKLLPLTTDNGCEFLDDDALKNLLAGKVYYTHAYAAREKGSVENANRLVRRWYSKGTDFSKVPLARIAELERHINSIARKLLHGKSAQEAYAAA